MTRNRVKRENPQSPRSGRLFFLSDFEVRFSLGGSALDFFLCFFLFAARQKEKKRRLVQAKRNEQEIVYFLYIQLLYTPSRNVNFCAQKRHFQLLRLNDGFSSSKPSFYYYLAFCRPEAPFGSYIHQLLYIQFLCSFALSTVGVSTYQRISVSFVFLHFENRRVLILYLYILYI